jgi:hypothetical protein
MQLEDHVVGIFRDDDASGPFNIWIPIREHLRGNIARYIAIHRLQ